VLFLSQRKLVEKLNNLQPAAESLSPQTLSDGSAPLGDSPERQTWMSVVRESGLIDSEQLQLIYISNGKQWVPDDFRMACQFNWLWFLQDLDAAEIQERLSIANDSIWIESCLHLAIKKGHEDVVRFLLDSKMDANIVRHRCGTPLGMATLTNQPAMVALLLGLEPFIGNRNPNSIIGLKRIISGVVQQSTMRHSTSATQICI
jgi:hypothetical protein